MTSFVGENDDFRVLSTDVKFNIYRENQDQHMIHISYQANFMLKMFLLKNWNRDVKCLKAIQTAGQLIFS